jgi:hypothetical protein
MAREEHRGSLWTAPFEGSPFRLDTFGWRQLLHHGGGLSQTGDWIHTIRTDGVRRLSSTPKRRSKPTTPSGIHLYDLACDIYYDDGIRHSEYFLGAVLHTPVDAWLMHPLNHERCLDHASRIFRNRLHNRDKDLPTGIEWRREIIHTFHGMEAATVNAERLDSSPAFRQTIGHVRRNNIRTTIELLLVQSAVEVASTALQMPRGWNKPREARIPEYLAAEFIKCYDLVSNRTVLDIALATYDELQQDDQGFDEAIRSAIHKANTCVAMDGDGSIHHSGRAPAPRRRTYTRQEHSRGRAARITRSAEGTRRNFIWLA